MPQIPLSRRRKCYRNHNVNFGTQLKFRNCETCEAEAEEVGSLIISFAGVCLPEVVHELFDNVLPTSYSTLKVNLTGSLSHLIRTWMSCI
jgi:hypothetical protein